MKVFSVNSKSKCLEGSLDLLESFVSSPLLTFFYLKITESWTAYTRKFPETTEAGVFTRPEFEYEPIWVTLLFNILLSEAQSKLQ